MGLELIGGTSGDAVGVGDEAASPLHIVLKPQPYGSLGHYRSTVRFALATAQNANSRLWEIRNPHASNLIVPTRLRVSVLPVGTITAAYRLELDLFRLTSFSAVDTTNVVTPTVSPRRGATMAAAPGSAALRHVTVAGAAAGMTGGTLTKDGGASAILEAWAATAGASTFPVERELLDDVNGTHPFVLGQNEGLLLENVAAGSATSNVVSVFVDFSWAELTAF